MRPFIDKVIPEAWAAAQQYTASIGAAAMAHGLHASEGELIKMRASQLNGCVYCLDLHGREARAAGVTQQQLDVLPAWRDLVPAKGIPVFTEREKAALAVAEAATRLPLDDDAAADLEAARGVLGDEAFAAAEWVAVTINAFNRISILSEHPVRARDAEGKVRREQS